MVTQNVSRKQKGKKVYSEKKTICDYPRTNKMPKTDQITKIAPDVRTNFWVTI